METFLIDIYLPAVQHSYELRVPADLNVQVAAVLAARAISPLTDGMFEASKACRLARKKDGTMLNPAETIREAGVINGSRLLLI